MARSVRHHRLSALDIQPSQPVSYQINLTGSRFNRSAWLADVRERIVDTGDSLSPLCRELNGFGQPSDDSDLWLLPVGGIRGVFASHDSEGTNLSLPAASSRSDFALAARLVNLALRNGAEAIDENQIHLNGCEDEFTATHRSQMEFFHFMLNNGESDDKGHFPLGPLKVRLLESDAHGSWIDLEQKLVERVGKFSSCGFAPIKKSGVDPDRVIISLYQQAACLIHSRTRMVVVGGGCLPDESDPIEAETFFSFFSGEMEDLGNWIYVPAARPDEIVSLVANRGRRIPPHLPGGLPAATPPPLPGSQSQGLSDQEWCSLIKAPIHIFLMIASADGEPDNKAFAAFTKFIDTMISDVSPAVGRMARETRDHHGAILEELMDPDFDALDEWRRFSALMDSARLPLDETRAVRRFLLDVANRTARPSSGLFGFGRGVSTEKQKMLVLLNKILKEG